MKRPIATIALPLLLLACAEAEAPADPDVQDPAALNEEAAGEQPGAPLDVSGSWQVVSLNNAPLRSVHPMTASFGDGETLTLASQCVRLSFDLNREGQSIAPEEQPAGGCGRTLTDGERMVRDAIPDLNIIADVDGDLWMTGTSGVIKMTRGG